MLTEREEKLIKRYCIYPKLAMTGVIMALALGVPYILLEMIDDLAFHNDRAVFWGLYVYIGFVILYMVLFCWCALVPRFGMRREEWRELQRRADVRQSQTDYSGAVAGSLGMSAAGRLMRKSENKAVRGAGAAALEELKAPGVEIVDGPETAVAQVLELLGTHRVWDRDAV